MGADRKIYFISEHANQEWFHGGVGPVDIERILLRENAIPLQLPFHFDFSIKAKIARLLYLISFVSKIGPGSVLVFQHPLYARMNQLLLMLLRMRPSVTAICLVADIDGLKDGNENILQKEKRFFRRFRYFILHNKKMEHWLRSFHPGAITSSLNCFDFLTANENVSRTKSKTIVFAGNLQKSTFLEKLDNWLEKSPSLSVNLYGPAINNSMLRSARVSYKGVHAPHSLPSIIEGSFGLIWDGEGIEGLEGSLGNYMEYISHHKLSLYIVSGLPAIVHSKAGSAEFILQNRIGFTVDSLLEIEEKINGLSEEDYMYMVSATYHLAEEIRSGNGVRNALGELLGKMN